MVTVGEFQDWAKKHDWVLFGEREVGDETGLYFLTPRGGLVTVWTVVQKNEVVMAGATVESMVFNP